MVGDPFNLERLLAAQSPVFATVLEELAAGRKRSHWMWFVFPQLRGLGHSAMAQMYGIESLDEARAYLANTELGPQLISCTQLVLAVKGRSIHDIFGSPDDMKFRSSMTLFSRAAPASEDVFQKALDAYCNGVADDRTLKLLEAQGASS
jgi:uncharacterized protein (DUF1810 family)